MRYCACSPTLCFHSIVLNTFRHVVVFASTAIMFGVSFVMLRRVVGLSPPWLGLLLTLLPMGLAKVDQPLFMLSVPNAIRGIRAWVRFGRLIAAGCIEFWQAAAGHCTALSQYRGPSRAETSRSAHAISICRSRRGYRLLGHAPDLSAKIGDTLGRSASDFFAAQLVASKLGGLESKEMSIYL